jgi:hypothetical protein
MSLMATVLWLGNSGFPFPGMVAAGAMKMQTLGLALMALGGAVAIVLGSGVEADEPTGNPRRRLAPTLADGARRSLEGFRTFLAARDGEPNPLRHTLARREEFFAGIERNPVHSRLPIDRAAFQRNLARRSPEPGLDARMLWLLATAKANQAERFGVGLAELYGKIRFTDVDPIRVHIPLQETYHTRILADVVAMFGLTVDPHPPQLIARAIVKTIIGLPEHWGLPLTGLSEMAGCVLFRALRDRGIELCAEEPEVAARIRLLYDEILADELSHVGYIAAQLGPWGKKLTRGLYRVLAWRMAARMPEVRLLFGRAELERRFSHFDLDAMVAEFPDRTYAAATI